MLELCSRVRHMRINRVERVNTVVLCYTVKVLRVNAGEMGLALRTIASGVGEKSYLRILYIRLYLLGDQVPVEEKAQADMSSQHHSRQQASLCALQARSSGQSLLDDEEERPQH